MILFPKINVFPSAPKLGGAKRGDENVHYFSAVRCISFISFSIFIMSLSVSSYAQMPGWATIRDRDGNKYYVDRNFKIHVEGEPGAQYKPVALENLQFSSEQSEELIKNHHPADGLRILKAIMTLSALDTRASGAGLKASKAVNAMIRREKDRYVRYDHDSALYVVRLNGKHYVYNSWMNWDFVHEGSVEVLARKNLEKEGYARDGAAFGIRFDTSPEKTFDCIFTVNCEELNYKIKIVDTYVELTRNKNPDDTFVRTVIAKSDDSILYRFSSVGSEPYAGLELFIIKNKRGYHLEAVSPAGKEAALAGSMKKLMSGFSVKGSN
jgi:hypothetical protein